MKEYCFTLERLSDGATIILSQNQFVVGVPPFKDGGSPYFAPTGGKTFYWEAIKKMCGKSWLHVKWIKN
jgi:hypothetical protein